MRLEEQNGIVTLRMEAGKANAMGQQFISAGHELLDQLERSTAACLIITGDRKNFSAGLNLPELSQLDRGQLSQFLDSFCNFFIRLMRLPQFIIAAIEGNAIAGGGILALSCDYRLFARGDGRIGLNEIQLGIPFPRQVLEIVRMRLPRSSYFDVLYRGQLFNAEQARAIGFVDELVEPAELIDRANNIASELAGKSRLALAAIKKDLTTPELERFEMMARLGDSDFLDVWFSADTRARIGELLATLKAKKQG